MNALTRYLGASCAAATALVAIAAHDAGAAPVKWATYEGDPAFIITLPEGYAVDTAYRYDQLGEGKEIAGTKFTIPERMWTGSNLSADTYLSVETLPDAGACSASRFLPDGAEVHDRTDGGVAYSVGTFEDAGAGNLYEQTVYALTDSSPCRAVRTLVHSTSIGNYDPGAVEAFNRAALAGQFDKIRRSLKLR